MNAAFTLLALMTLGGAMAAMGLRNLVHCLLAVVVSFLGLAGLYLQLSATFVGLAQVLVYVGAVAILLVFAILLTRGRESKASAFGGGASPVVGLGVALLVAGGLLGAVMSAPIRGHAMGRAPDVRAIGERLMTEYVLPLEAVALLLTAALIGAVILAMPEPVAVSKRVDTPSPQDADDRPGGHR
jgi:NADH-quinone oxidoreductase subunit J